jgi:membrane protein required for beta-lactamase induction
LLLLQAGGGLRHECVQQLLLLVAPGCGLLLLLLLLLLLVCSWCVGIPRLHCMLHQEHLHCISAAVQQHPAHKYTTATQQLFSEGNETARAQCLLQALQVNNQS